MCAKGGLFRRTGRSHGSNRPKSSRMMRLIDNRAEIVDSVAFVREQGRAVKERVVWNITDYIRSQSTAICALLYSFLPNVLLLVVRLVKGLSKFVKIVL